MFYKTFIFLFFFMFVSSVHSQYIKHIFIHGLQHVSIPDVSKNIFVYKNKKFSRKDILKSMHTLLNTNNFIKIRVRKIKKSLIFLLKERPLIKKIIFKGNNIISDDFFKKKLNIYNIYENKIFNINNFNNYILFLRKYYHNKGYFINRIHTSILSLTNNCIVLKINIFEGPQYNVSNIILKGNKSFSTNLIIKKLSYFNFSFFWKFFLNNRYSISKFKKSLLNLYFFYKNNGFLDIKIYRIKFIKLHDKKNICIKIYLHEGKKYKFKKLFLYGLKLKNFNDVQKIICNQFNNNFSKINFFSLKREINNFYPKLKLSNIKISYHYDLDKLKKIIYLHIAVNPIKKFLINKIYFFGSNKKKDIFLWKIVKRIKKYYFNEKLLQKSCKDLLNTNLFSNVHAKVYKINNSSKKVDVCYFLTENKGGNISFSTSYDKNTGILFRFLFFNKNILGLGNSLYITILKNLLLTNIDIRLSKSVYFLKHFILRSHYFFNSIKKNNNISDHIYKLFNFNTSLYTNRINNKRFFIRLGYVNTHIFHRSPQISFLKYILSIKDKIPSYPIIRNFSLRDFIVKYIFDFNDIKTNNFTKIGNRIRFKGKFTLPYSDNVFHKITLNTESFFPLERTKNFFLHLSSKLGLGMTLGKNIFPFYENYYAGGSNSIRGFKDKSIGPVGKYYNLKKDVKKNLKNNINSLYDTTNPIGGNFLINNNIELLCPNINLSNQLFKHFQCGLFLDTVNIWDENLNNVFVTLTKKYSKNLSNINNIYMSTGIFIRWFSFLGPINFTFSIPLLSNNVPKHNIIKYNFDYN